METTIFKTVTGKTLEQLFEKCDLFSIRYYTTVNEIPEDQYNPKSKYKFEIKVRHPEGTDANVLFNKAILPLNRKLKDLKPEELSYIGDLLGYEKSVAKHKASRFLFGMQNKLTNWEYDEVINFGDMHKVLSVINYLLSVNIKFLNL